MGRQGLFGSRSIRYFAGVNVRPSPLEKRLLHKVGEAVSEWDLIAEGDRILVAVSGGKDSYALLSLLDLLRRRAPIRFEIVAWHLATLGDQAAKVLVETHDCGGRSLDDVLTLGARLHDGGAPGVELAAVLLGDVHQEREHVGRHGTGQQRDQVRLARFDQPLDALHHEVTDRIFESGHVSGREALADQTPELCVLGGVHHHDGGGEPELLDLVVFEGESIGGRVDLGRARCTVDVLEARQHVEVLLRHVVGRRLVP